MTVTQWTGLASAAQFLKSLLCLLQSPNFTSSLSFLLVANKDLGSLPGEQIDLQM